MKKLIALTTLAAVTAAGTQTFAGAQTLTRSNVDFGLSAGYYDGLSVGGSIHARNLYGPFGVRLSADYIFPQDPLNDSYNFGGATTFGQLKSTTGATEYGNQFSVALDATYQLPSQLAGVDAYFYAGPRYDFYSATADFSASGSGTTTYTTNQFGLGAGFLANYALTPNLLLTGDLGLDYYFPSTITATGSDGSSTSFAPNTSGYSDTASFINQPSLVPKARLGLTYRY